MSVCLGVSKVCFVCGNQIKWCPFSKIANRANEHRHCLRKDSDDVVVVVVAAFIIIVVIGIIIVLSSGVCCWAFAAVAFIATSPLLPFLIHTRVNSTYVRRNEQINMALLSRRGFFGAQQSSLNPCDRRCRRRRRCGLCVPFILMKRI